MVNGAKGITVADGGVEISRESDAGREVYRLPLPAVVGVKEGINLPRYPTMKGRLASKKVQVANVTAAADPGGQRMVRLRTPAEQASRPSCSDRGSMRSRRWWICSVARGVEMILAVIEHDRGAIAPAAFEAVTAATRLAAQTDDTVEALTIGSSADSLVEVLAAYGVDTVHQAHHEMLGDYGPEAWGDVVAQAVAHAPSGRRRSPPEPTAATRSSPMPRPASICRWSPTASSSRPATRSK